MDDEDNPLPGLGNNLDFDALKHDFDDPSFAD
jgi:hypothetical protein